MKSLTVRVPDALFAKLNGMARRRKSTRAEIAREALERYLANGAGGRTAYDLVSDLLGSFEGPADLSTNKKYLEGFGE